MEKVKRFHMKFLTFLHPHEYPCAQIAGGVQWIVQVQLTTHQWKKEFVRGCCLESSNITGYRSISVTVNRTGNTALVGRWTTAVGAGINRWAAVKEGVGARRAAVVLERPEYGICVNLVAGSRQAAGVGAFQVVAL
jgi:hypothetical protein